MSTRWSSSRCAVTAVAQRAGLRAHQDQNLTVRTVAFHKYRMMPMLNIKSSAELVRFAVIQHIV